MTIPIVTSTVISNGARSTPPAWPVTVDVNSPGHSENTVAARA